MILARFVEKKNTEGQFTRGKIYLANEEYHYLATTIGQLDIVDDAGIHIKVDPKTEEFVFPEVAYAVWIGPPIKNIEVGKVFVVDDVDNESFHIEGDGYLVIKNFEILDSTNLHPSMYVQEIATGMWKKVMRVNNESMICIENESTMRHPTDFRFFVFDGAIARQPILYCLNETGVDLTEGKAYPLISNTRNSVVVVNDIGCETEYDRERFDTQPK
jgi:hypothetical protein